MAPLILSTFTLAGSKFAVPIARVQEVLPVRTLALTPIPLAPSVVRGIVNVRGEIVTVFDARRSLDLPACSIELSVHLLLRIDGAPLSLLVDEVGDVLIIDDELFERTPDTLRGAGRELIAGAYKLSDGLLLLLDLDSLIRAAARSER